MVELALKYKTKHLLLAALCCVSITLLLTAPVFAADQNIRLSELEQHLFFRTYPQEETTLRLDRIEKRVFGQSLNGSIEERLNKLSSVAQHPETPDGLAPAPAIAPVDTAPSAVAPTAAPDLSTKETNRKNDHNSSSASSKPILDDKEYAKQRARIAIMAAREEEIASLLSSGVKLWRDKRGYDAKEKFEQVIRLDPYNAEAHFSMGIILETSGNLAAAIPHYRAAAKARPDSSEYQNTLTSAEDKLSHQPKTNPNQLEVRNLSEKAVAAYKAADYSSALELYKQIDSLSPNQALIKYNLGTVYLWLKEPSKALEYYRKAVQLDPNDQRFAEAYQKLQLVADPTHAHAPPFAPANNNFGNSTNFEQRSPESARNNMASYGITAKTTPNGLCVTSVGNGSRAAHAGLKRDDIIRAVNGFTITSENDLNDLLSRTRPDNPLPIIIERDTILDRIDL